MSATQVMPLGGKVIDVQRFGSKEQYTRVWAINPATLEECAIMVWTAPEQDVRAGDECWFWPHHSPGWRRQGEDERTGFLPRIGHAWDPVNGTALED